jgi:hypothetical protein
MNSMQYYIENKVFTEIWDALLKKGAIAGFGDEMNIY